MQSNGLVLVTGVSGFLGGHVAKELLRSNYRVRGAVRTAQKATDFQRTHVGAEACIIPDITCQGAFKDALDGVQNIIHCASPFTYTVDSVQRDILEPAIQGTTEILKAAASATLVQRVVITSSLAAVIDPKLNPRSGYHYDENDWNPIGFEEALTNPRSAYQASKKLAELAAWNFLEQEQPAFTIVTICPPLIFGPRLDPASPQSGIPSESCQQLLRHIDLPPKETSMPAFVDVRDAARIHVKSLNTEKISSSERFLICGGPMTWKAIHEIATRGFCTPETLEVDKSYTVNTSKADHVFRLNWIPLEKSVKDTIDGFFPSRGS